jgi:hypothetical protein
LLPSILRSELIARGAKGGNEKFKNKNYAGAETEFRAFLSFLEGKEDAEATKELRNTVEVLGLSLAYQGKCTDLVVLLDNYYTKLSRDQLINMVSTVDVIRQFKKGEFQRFRGVLAKYELFSTKDRQILLDRCIRCCREIEFRSELKAFVFERLKISEDQGAKAEATNFSRMAAEVYLQEQDLQSAESLCSLNLHVQTTLLGIDHHYCQLSIELFTRILEAKQSEPSATALATRTRQLLNDEFLGTFCTL